LFQNDKTLVYVVGFKAMTIACARLPGPVQEVQEANEPYPCAAPLVVVSCKIPILANQAVRQALLWRDHTGVWHAADYTSRVL
jgi:hypothetical protein